MPTFIPQKGLRPLPGNLSYYYLVGYGGIGLYIVANDGFRLVFGTLNPTKTEAMRLLSGWQKVAKPLVMPSNSENFIR